MSRQETNVMFPGGLSEADEEEARVRGYYGEAVVQSGGQRYSIAFYDPIRLQQTIDDDIRLGRPCFAEPGLVVVPEVTREAMEAAVRELVTEGFFQRIAPDRSVKD